MLNEVVKFHTPNIIQYHESKITMTKEWPAHYKMSSIAVMEPREAFVGRAMGQPNI
jgi:hypothetical protein